jgi:hypothetical protein
VYEVLALIFEWEGDEIVERKEFKDIYDGWGADWSVGLYTGGKNNKGIHDSEKIL